MTALHLRVTTIRSQNPFGFGGCIFTGRLLDLDGDVADATRYVVVKVPGPLLGAIPIQVGQTWSVIGATRDVTRAINGFSITEQQIDASDVALIAPSGEHVVSFLAECPDFPGVGFVKARKLWSTFGVGLYDILDKGDVEILCRVVSKECAVGIVTGWGLQGESRTLQWLQKHGFDITLGRKVIECFGARASELVEEDPYRLLSFSGSWKLTDRLAIECFGLRRDDLRRLTGAIEEALYRIFASGHTLASPTMVRREISKLLGPLTYLDSWPAQLKNSLASALGSGMFVGDDSGNIQLLGPYVMERIVARTITERLRGSEFASILDDDRLAETIASYEKTEGVQLSSEQSLAVRTAAGHTVTLILGGAGVGKTTVLKALYDVYDATNIRVFQMAIAGKAAKRMEEATGRPAMTVASFLKNTQPDDLDEACAIVVDEASMLDLISMSSLCSLIPEHARIVLVGDPSQLMPVGPGLVLHALAGNADIPQVELKRGHRFGAEIANAAGAIRVGVWPEISTDATCKISFIPCDSSDIVPTVLGLFAEDPENTQILSPLRNGLSGTRLLNAESQKAFSGVSSALRTWNSEFDCWENTGLRLNDPVICTRNLWHLGLRNGSLGRLVAISGEPVLIKDVKGNEVGHSIASILWDDGELRPVFISMLEHFELAYAITVHKAQGSQWPRVLVAVSGNKLLDRSLIYTAMTRARHQVVLVGDLAAAKAAVERQSNVDSRNVGLIKAIKFAVLQRVEGLPTASTARSLGYEAYVA